MKIRLHRRAIVSGAVLGLLATTTASALEAGPLKIGGAIRASYTQGDYAKDGSGAPQRGGNGGNFELDVFRINVDFAHENWIGKGEYRWYDGYNFLHTGWLGYASDAFGRLEAGLVRTPFGVGPYGPANSWFFDQHYYLGLADMMKLGATYSRRFDRWAFDVGYYPADMVNGKGASDESARYSNAVVAEDAGGIPGAYEQRHQFNARATYDVEEIGTTLGASAQWSVLDAQDDRAEDGDAYAAAIHAKSQWGAFGLMLQLTGYAFDADYRPGADGVRPSNDLINLGAYDFAWPVASRGLVPSVAVSYTIEKPFEWIDAVTFYNDFSVVLKDGEMDGDSFNDSALNTTGMSIARGGWFIYVDYALSNGNLFVGNRDDVYGDTVADSSVGDLGANRNDRWNSRFNINFGYYF
jgi:hypothetical protein